MNDSQPTPAGEARLLEFQGVSKWYGPITALMDVSFHVGTEVVGLVGRNGVGKSTLLKLGAGLLRPSQGRVTMLGCDTASCEARSQIGFCPDIERLYEPLRGRDFVAWLLRYHGWSSADAARRAGEVLDELGLGANMHRPIREYSKGMRQRVRLAQALAHRPRLVLLDEPMTGLDPVARAELANTIAALPARGVGVLVSSHVLHELEAIADRVVLIHQGRLRAEGRVADLRAHLPDHHKQFRIVAGEARALAARLLALPQVLGVALAGDTLRITVAEAVAFLAELTRIAAEWPPGVREVSPVDDDLAFVFEHLVG